MVPRETPIYERLVFWAAWATDRRHFPRRDDALSAGFQLTDNTVKQLQQARQRYFPRSAEAIEKAVARLKINHDDYLLYYLVDQYFLRWRDISTIAIAEGMSEFQVTQYLERALRIVARTVPVFDKQLDS